MHKDFEKVKQLFFSSETDGKLALQLLKGQADLEEEVIDYFNPLLEVFNKKKIAALPAILQKIKAHKEPKKQFLPLLKDPVFSELLRNREELTIKNYPIKELFDLGTFPKLRKLTIHDNKSLDQLPESFGNFPALYIFRLYANKIKKIPSSFFECMLEIEALHLNNNKLEEIPSSIVLLQKLQLLNLSKNQLEHVPTFLEKLKALKHLYLSRNKLSSLPESLMNLEALEELDLSYNKKIKLIPDFLTKMDTLKRLDLTNNGYKKLPENLDQLTQVQLINLNSNQLSSLPDSISKLKNLGGLLLYNNPISKEEQERIKTLLPHTTISFSS